MSEQLYNSPGDPRVAPVVAAAQALVATARLAAADPDDALALAVRALALVVPVENLRVIAGRHAATYTPQYEPADERAAVRPGDEGVFATFEHGGVSYRLPLTPSLVAAGPFAVLKAADAGAPARAHDVAAEVARLALLEALAACEPEDAHQIGWALD